MSRRRTAAAVLVLLCAGCAGGDDGSGSSRGQAAVPAPPMHADQLLGLDRDALTALIGPADFTRSDGPAELWQYRASDCILDLFLYATPPQAVPRVAHVETRDRSDGGAGSAACVTTLLDARRMSPKGRTS